MKPTHIARFTPKKLGPVAVPAELFVSIEEVERRVGVGLDAIRNFRDEHGRRVFEHPPLYGGLGCIA